MDCTNCGGNIEHISLGYNTVKKCKSCHGFLITDNNLMEILSNAINIDTHNPKNKKQAKKIIPKTIDEFVSKLNCHLCDTPMENYEYMYSSGIRIDRCPSCSTLWLDKGKLLSIYKYINHLEGYDCKIKKLIPKMLDVKREVETTFQKIKEDSNIYRLTKKK